MNSILIIVAAISPGCLGPPGEDFIWIIARADSWWPQLPGVSHGAVFAANCVAGGAWNYEAQFVPIAFNAMR